MKTKGFILIAAAMFLFVSIIPQDTYCQWASQSKWDNKSDELPGMSGGAVIAIASGVIVTGLVTYLIVKKSKENKSSSHFIGDQPEHLLAQSFQESSSFFDEIKNASQQSSVELIAGYNNSNSRIDYNINTGLAVGLRFRF